MRKALMLVLASLIASSAFADALITAYRAPVAPVVDGRLDDACWQSALVSSHFLRAQGLGLPGEQTRVRLAWDDASLYLGVEAFEGLLEPRLNMMHVVSAKAAGPDARVFDDDCVEFFLQPPGASYFHFAANSDTGRYEGIGTADSWDCEWQCVARRGPASYVLEMAIPFAALGAKPSGDWRANFTRNRPHEKEYSTWSGLQGAFHQPEAFGSLRFSESGPGMKALNLDRDGTGYTLSAEISGNADASTALSATVSAAGTSTVKSVQGAGAKRLAIPTPREALETGRLQLEYSLKQGETIMLASAPITEIAAAGVVYLALETTQAKTSAFVNGEPVEAGALPSPIMLNSGLNVIAIEAQADGNAPSVRPLVSTGAGRLNQRWLTRTDAPPEDWQRTIKPEGWQLAAEENGRLWPGGEAGRCYLVAGLFVGKSGPQLFPKMDTFYVPRGSSQLMRVYVPSPSPAPSANYRMVVETPAVLKYRAVDAISGGTAPEVTQAATYEQDGVRMARHYVTYDMLPGQGMELSMRWGDKSGQTLAYQPTLTAGGTTGWRHLSMVLDVPRGAQSAHPLVIKWQDRGITGTFWVDNVVFREKDSDENLLKMGSFDEPEWGGLSLLQPEGVDGSKCVKIVSPPERADRQQAIWVDKDDVVPVEEGKQYVIELDVRCEELGSPNSTALCGLLFEAPADCEEQQAFAYTYFQTLDGAVTALPRRSTVTILPALKNVRPERARICPCYYGSRFQSPEVAEAFAESCYASGITWTYGKSSNDIAPLLMDRGHKLILSIGWEPWGAPAGAKDLIKEHPELQAMDFKGNRISHSFCPTWMLAEGDEVMKALEDSLLAVVNSEPYTGANWDLEQPVIDPPTFCTCERCLTAFRKFADLPQDVTVDADTILSKYPSEWTDFRCTQNAEMAGRLRAILRKADKPVEFSLYSGYQTQRTKEHYGVDWKLMAPHLDFGIGGYGGGREQIFDTVAALGDVPFMGGEMWYLSDRDDSRPTPRMETWRNRILRQFADSGGNGCLIWWLPPMDGGAFYATSEATEIIAKYEGFFALSRRCDEKVKVTGVDPSNWSAFEKDGQTLVMLLNFKPEPIKSEVRVGGKTYEAEIEAYGVEIVMAE